MFPKLQLLRGCKGQSCETRISQMSLLKCWIIFLFFIFWVVFSKWKLKFSLLQESFNAICTLEKNHCHLSANDKDFCCPKWKSRTSKFSFCLAPVVGFWHLNSEVRLIFALKIDNLVSKVEIVREKNRPL